MVDSKTKMVDTLWMGEALRKLLAFVSHCQLQHYCSVIIRTQKDQIEMMGEKAVHPLEWLDWEHNESGLF